MTDAPENPRRRSNDPSVTLSVAAIAKAGPKFDKVAEIRRLKLAQLARVDELDPSLVHHELTTTPETTPTDATPAATDPDKVEFDPHGVEVLRKCFRAVADPAWAARPSTRTYVKTNQDTIPTNLDELARTYKLEVHDDGTFSYFATNGRRACATPRLRLSVHQARAMIAYLVARVHAPIVPPGRANWWWYRAGTLSAWEQPAHALPKKD
jgi:hypothetical protein